MIKNEKYKYQDLIDKENLTLICPYEICIPSTGKAYRWVVSPIDDEKNFLPNLKYWDYTNKPRRVNSKDDLLKCSNCAVSLFISKEHAKKKFENFPVLFRKNLGYTHVAFGSIENKGIMSKAGKSGHFELFEYEGVDLKSSFAIVDELKS